MVKRTRDENHQEFGNYVLHENSELLRKSIELERAIELIAKPTQRGNATLKTFGEHPTEKKNITAHDGKFGPYVKCGKINASILGDQTIDSLKLEDAIRLIDERNNLDLIYLLIINVVCEYGSSTFLPKSFTANRRAFFAWRSTTVLNFFSLIILKAKGKTNNPKLNI